MAQLNITWAAPTVAYAKAIELARQLDHHLFDTLHHAVALSVPGAVLVTANRRYFDKNRHSGQIAWLADFNLASSIFDQHSMMLKWKLNPTYGRVIHEL